MTWADGQIGWRKSNDLGNCIELLIEYSAKQNNQCYENAQVSNYIISKSRTITVEWDNKYVVYLTIVTSQFCLYSEVSNFVLDRHEAELIQRMRLEVFNNKVFELT